MGCTAGGLHCSLPAGAFESPGACSDEHIHRAAARAAASAASQDPSSLHQAAVPKQLAKGGECNMPAFILAIYQSAFFSHSMHQLLAASCLQHQTLPCDDTTKLLDQLRVPAQLYISTVPIPDQKANTLVHYFLCVSSPCHHLDLSDRCSTGSKYHFSNS